MTERGSKNERAKDLAKEGPSAAKEATTERSSREERAGSARQGKGLTQVTGRCLERQRRVEGRGTRRAA
jgi:hypothetical protein